MKKIHETVKKSLRQDTVATSLVEIQRIAAGQPRQKFQAIPISTNGLSSHLRGEARIGGSQSKRRRAQRKTLSQK
jgi:hypothetical protein